MRPIRYGPITPLVASTNGFGNAVTGASFTLTAGSTTDALAHKVTVLNNTATDHSAKTLALVGTDADGKRLTETLTAPSGNATVTSTNHFLTLTSVTPSATIGADTFNIGWSADAVSPSKVLESRGELIATLLTLLITGTLTVKVQYTTDDVYSSSFVESASNWFDHPTLTSKTSSDNGNLSVPVTAVRLNVTAYTSGTVGLNVLQSLGAGS